MSRLKSSPNSVLNRSGCYLRSPFSENLLNWMRWPSSLNTDELDSLVESGLARQADAETYDVHDLIREFLLRSLSSALRQEFHAKCVDWYEKQTPSHDMLIELVYHSIKAAQYEKASELVVSRAGN